MISWLHKLLGKDKEDEQPEPGRNHKQDPPAVPANPLEGLEGLRFGRYSDNNKTLIKSRKWYAAEDLYKEKKYEEALDAIFDYLRDETEDNLHLEKTENGFKFDLVQGSRKIYGESDGKFISARVPLAVMQTPSTAAMRRLLELNYTLYYTRTALDDKNTLYMVFDSEITTGSPNKIYYGLRELAVKADRQDDLLLADFPTLKTADLSHIEQLTDHELDVKYKYFRKWIEEALRRAEALNADSFSGAIAYILLGTVYRIDFLIAPESKLLSDLERIHNMYWEKKEDIPLIERNQMMKDAIRKLLDISRESFANSVFRAKGTFSMASPAKPEKVKDHIFNANKDSHWYIDNKYPDIARLINEYGVLHNQFIYSMPKVQTDITVIYMAVMHPEFFLELGMKEPLYDTTNKEFHDEAIKDAIDIAIGRFKDKYNYMKWDHKRVLYDNLYDFGVTLSEHMANLNLETKRS
ncbi:MAG: hypothetical protein EOP56_17770 [Sphingobacteriales bacterium]|nr:MAG: hypothetical protein EOP56_17770 [Sphingobacteriales bacterium]